MVSLAAGSESCKLIITEEHTKAIRHHPTARNTFTTSPDLVHRIQLGTSYGDFFSFFTPLCNSDFKHPLDVHGR